MDNGHQILSHLYVHDLCLSADLFVCWMPRRRQSRPDGQTPKYVRLRVTH
jgi:hypothetical protein